MPPLAPLLQFGLGSYTQRYLSSFMSESLDSSKDVEDVRRRYTRERKVHYLYGLADHEVGDNRCEAFAQGDTHRELMHEGPATQWGRGIAMVAIVADPIPCASLSLSLSPLLQ
jgi:hypothetical protein